MEKFTWKQLAEAINNLPQEEQERQCKVIIDDASQSTKITMFETLPHDIYINKNDEDDCGDLKTLKEAHGEDFNQEDYELATRKGTAFLSTME